MKSLLYLLFPLMTVVCGLANEPGWTPEQRMGHRDAVVVAEVVTVKKIKNMDTDIDLYSAVLRIDRTLKPHPELKEPEVTAFFLMSPKGAGHQCPHFADPKEKMTGTFYLRYHDYLTGKKVFLIEMGSDISDNKESEPDHSANSASLRGR